MKILSSGSNIAMIGALSFYKLTDDKKYKAFCKWITQNEISSIKDIKFSSIISVFDRIYENRPKKAFMSMWFDTKTIDTYQKVVVVAKQMKENFGITLDVVKVDEHDEGCSEVISKRIYDGIDNCDLLIADLSYNNKNVHHEVGYAQGLGKKVLMLYYDRENENTSHNIGSNISMHEQLRFGSYDQLERDLLGKLKDFFDVK